MLLTAATSCSVGADVATVERPAALRVHVIPAALRQEVPELSGTTLSGEPFALRDDLGRAVVVINVWASWCAPCRQEMPMLARAYEEQANRLVVVGIDERDRGSSARALSSSVGATYPSLVDTDSRLLLKLPMLPHNAIPSSLFIDGAGRVAAWVAGPLSSSELTSVVSRVAGGR
jgi:thiol-disulfide isomerase/thioredoxin